MKKWIIAGIVLILIFVIGETAFFTVREDETAVVQRFGEIVAVYVQRDDPAIRQAIESTLGKSVSIHVGAGLKTRLPIVDNVLKYTHQLISYDNTARVVTTSDKKQLFFNNNAQWRVDNPVLFYKTVSGSIPVANDRVDNILYSHMNEKVGKIDAHTLITNKDVVEEMLQELIGEVNMETSALGITVIDVRIKRTDVPEANYESIYERMITERNRIAAQYRSEGDEEALKLRSTTDKTVTILLSEANMDAETIRGEGDQEAARIFNEAYANNPEFFEFYNYLETYRVTIGQQAMLVIPLDSPFAKYLLGIPEKDLPAVIPSVQPAEEE